MFSGSVPINLSFNAMQALSVKGIGIFRISYEMRLVISNRIKKLPSLTLDMGDDVPNKDIAEFTVVPKSYAYFEVIIRNSYGIARRVTVFNYLKNPHYGEILEGVIKVAGGEILYADKNKYAVVNGKYVQIGKNNTLDIIPNGNGGVKRIKVDNNDAKIKSALGNYTLKTNGDLFSSSRKIAEKIISIGVFAVEDISGLLVGKEGTVQNAVKAEAYNEFRKAGVEKSWLSAYDTFIDKQTKPTCEWGGIGEAVAHTTTPSFSTCLNTVPTKTIPYRYFATGEDGKTYKIAGNTITEIKTYHPDADGFNALYDSSSNNPVLFNHKVGGTYQEKLYFEEAELGEKYHSNGILRR